MAKQRIVVGISGGVDSAVAAMLLLQQGYAVEGLFMKNWEEDDDAEYCAAEEDYKEARAVCAQLGIPLHAVNFAHEYWERVFSYFLDEYRAGRTPNPDVLCNKEIKFKAFLDHALRLGADGIATGHYARCTQENGQYHLRKARDTNKDQSYFLYLLNQDALRYAHFPLGELEKPQVRALAQEAGLPNHARKDSTGICFIGERKFKTFLSRYLPAQPGEIRTLDDKVIGRHDGLMYYTIGQRQGLGIGGIKDSDAGQPWYVVDKDLTRNMLRVVQGEEHPALYKNRLHASQLHWIADAPPPLPFAGRAKIRYRQADQTCVIETIADGVASLIFEQAQRAVTPGQSLVMYRGNECLGGGVIIDTV